MNERNNPAGRVVHIDTRRTRRHARPAPLPKLSEAELDAHLQDQHAAADDGIGAILARRARAEREALARAHGVPGDLQRFSDSQLDELDAVACAAKEGRMPFDWRAGAAAIAAVAAILLWLGYVSGSFGAMLSWQP